MTFSLEIAKAIYREAIDGEARDDEPAAWWDAVAREMQHVVSAPSDRAAAVVIAWWHNDWSSVSDTASRSDLELDGPGGLLTCEQPGR